MKKICIITTVHQPLDTRIFYHEAVSLKKYYSVVLVSTTGKDFSKQGIEIKGLGVVKNRFSRFTKMFSALSRALEEKADVYHFHDLELIPMGLFLRLLGKRVIYDVHENNPEYILDKDWIPTIPLRWLTSYLVRFMETFGAIVFNGVIVVNEILLDRFKKWNKNTVVVMNFPSKGFGADFAKIDADEREKIAVFIGGIEKERGVLKILEFIKKNKDFYLKFLFIGTVKSEKLNKKIKAFIKKSNISVNQFEIIPQISHREIPKFLNKSYVGIIPFLKTRNNYLGTPQKTFEYMAYGLPIVASDLLFLREFVGKSKSGLLVEDIENTDQLKNAFDMVKSKKVWRELSFNSRKGFLETYNWESQEEKLFDLYERILE